MLLLVVRRNTAWGNHRMLEGEGMIRRLFLLLLCGLIVGCSGNAEKKPSTLAPADFDEAAMDAAIERARSEVDQFIAKFERGEGSQFAVKVPIEDGDHTEHFWLTNIRYEDGVFHGEIGNEPGVVKTVKLGQEWSIPKQEITDWIYMDDGRMYGNYTIRPLLDSMPPAQAKHIRRILAEDEVAEE